MKKLLTFLSILLMSSVVYSQTITLEFPEIDDAVPGTQIAVPIYVTAISNTIAAFEVHLNYDYNVLTPVGVQNHHANFLPTSNWYNNMTYNDSIVYVSFTDATFSGQPIAPGEFLCEVLFDYDPAGGYSHLHFWVDPPKSFDPEKGSTYFMSGADGGYADFTMTFVDGHVSDGSGLGTEWTGAASSAWDDAGNWTAGVPADGVDATIPVVVAKAVYPVITVSAVTGALNIASGAMLTVAPGGDLTTNGLFTNDGDFYITSDPGGFSGSYYDGALSGGVTGIGNYQFTRNITTVADSGSPDGWHFLASPLATSFVNHDMFDYWVNTFDETTGFYQHMVGNLTIPCDPAPLTQLNPMIGWSVKYDNAYLCNAVNPGTGLDIEMMGPMTDLNDGTAAFNYAPSYTPTSAWPGYNLLGNPYSSAISCGLINFAGSNLDGTVAVYDDMSLDFIEWTTDVPTLDIPPTQGFFVHATAAGGTFTLTGAERIHSGQYFFKDVIDNLVELQVSGNETHDNIFIKFAEGTSTGYDIMRDAPKMFASVPSVPQIYTTSGGQELAIDVQESAALVHMAFKVGVEGTYTIEAVETSNFANVVLEDTFTGIETDLLSDSYTFNYTIGDNPNRFIVHFTPLGTPELEANSIHIWSSERNIYVTVPATVTGDVAVYNMMGQEVVANKVIPGMNVIPVNDVNTYYVVKVKSNNIVKTEKVFIR